MVLLLLAVIALTACNPKGNGGDDPPASVTLESIFPDESLRQLVTLRLGNRADLTGQNLIAALAAINDAVLWIEGFGSSAALAFRDAGFVITAEVNGAAPSNVSGIEYLTGLMALVIENVPITTINLSNLTNLVNFMITGTQLTSLDVSNLSNLTNFAVDNNSVLITLDLRNIDVEDPLPIILDLQGTALTTLFLHNSNLTEANIINRPASLVTVDLTTPK